MMLNIIKILNLLDNLFLILNKEFIKSKLTYTAKIHFLNINLKLYSNRDQIPKLVLRRAVYNHLWI
jgi:hypothetical protein